jgi:hypothetical protein
MNKRYLLALVGLTVGTSALAAQNCDCTVYPFRPDPPCAASCSAKLLEKSDYSSLVNILGLKPDTAKQISTFSSSRKPTYLYEYSQALPKQDFEALNVRLRSLSQDEFRQLEKASPGTNLRPEKGKP